MKHCATLLLFAALALALIGCNAAQIGEILQSGGGPLDEPTVAAGLKEALRIGTERATDSTSRVDGFYGNALIRVAMPEQYRDVAGAMRRVGLGGTVDEFEVAMNRAAEKASGEAVDVFWSAITRMTIADAFGILNGGETAATDYFRNRTAAELRRRFQPIVTDKMKAVGLYRIHNDLIARYNQLPFDKPAAVDLDNYITSRAVDGIFTILAQEEMRIRENPAARTTDLLRRVFGSRDGS
jgi:hypothetical protein